MKKSIYIILLSLCFFTCGEQELINYDVYNGDALIKFESNSASILVDLGEEETVNIPISVSTFSSTERTITVEVEPFPEGTENVAQPENYSFNGTIIIPANELFGTLTFTGINSDGINEPLQLQLKIVDSNIDNATITDTLYTISISPKCTADFTNFEGDYAITTGDNYGYAWDWNAQNNLPLVLGTKTPNRFSSSNFYGWGNSQPVFFELSCTDNTVSVVPIEAYSTPGGYTFDITGGSGTYTEKGVITVAYNCSHASDGNFIITETYTKGEAICTMEIAPFLTPYSIETGDSYDYGWNWDGRTDLNLTQDDTISYRMLNVNFYGWENAQPVLFDLVCGTSEVKVVPIVGYTTPGGYSFDITGGSGTYDAEGNITVIFNCNDSYGDFTITETYSKP